MSRIKNRIIDGLHPGARALALVLAVTLLTGCSSVRLAYNNGPLAAWWWLDGYVDFSREQAPAVADDDLGVGAHIDDQRDFIAFPRRLGQEHAGGICAQRLRFVIRGEPDTDIGAIQQFIAPLQPFRPSRWFATTFSTPGRRSVHLSRSPEHLIFLRHKKARGLCHFVMRSTFRS